MILIMQLMLMSSFRYAYLECFKSIKKVLKKIKIRYHNMKVGWIWKERNSLCYLQIDCVYVILRSPFCLIAHAPNRRSAIPLNFTLPYSFSSRLHVTPTSDVMTVSRIAAWYLNANGAPRPRADLAGSRGGVICRCHLIRCHVGRYTGIRPICN